MYPMENEAKRRMNIDFASLLFVYVPTVSSFNRGEPFPFNLKCRLNSPRFDPTNTRDHYIIYAIIVSKECEISDGAQLNNDQKR